MSAGGMGRARPAAPGARLWRRHGIAILLSIWTLSAQAARLDQCTTLIDEVAQDWRAGKMAAVVAALQPAELECAGHARFNRVLGEALLAGGNPVDALMPLERAVKLDPADQGAQNALQQAWQVLARREAARAAHALPAGTGDGAAAAVERFHWQLMLEGSRGHDSNANLSTADHSIIVPGLNDLNITLDPASRQQASDYWGDSIHAAGVWAPSAELELRADAAEARRIYGVAPAASTENKSLALRAERMTRWGSVGLGIQSDWLQQGGDLVRIAQGGSVSWQPVGKGWPQLALDTVAYRYVGPMRGSDGFVEQVLSASHDFSFRGAQLGWTMLFGHDRATVFRADGDRQLYGVRLSAEGAIGRSWHWFAGYDRIDGRYDSLNPAFQVVRSDSLDSVNGGLSWQLWKELSVRAQLTLARQHSSIPLYAYRRADANLAFSYLFGN
jgi:hypothetical protein